MVIFESMFYFPGTTMHFMTFFGGAESTNQDLVGDPRHFCTFVSRLSLGVAGSLCCTVASGSA